VGGLDCQRLGPAIRSSAPGGNIGKPLMIALGALLASGVLFGRSGRRTVCEHRLAIDI
jgi:hypothetical protein